jgi:YD repeat-containing protein
MFRQALHRLVLALLWLGLCATAMAERYDYDALGRLVRNVDDLGQVTVYSYDGSGNLTQVASGGSAAPPVVSSIAPAIIRQNQKQSFVVTGTGLINVTVSIADAQISVANVVSTATQVAFDLTASSLAAPGPRTVNLRSAAGAATVALTVWPVLPTVGISPSPLAIPPDNLYHAITISLSSADVIDHTIALSSANPAIVAVSPASLTIPAGQTAAAASISGLSGGLSAVKLTSATLGNSSIPVFVLVDFRGLSTSYASPVGVVLSPSAGAPSTNLPVYSRAVTVALGSYLAGITPTRLGQGSGATSLVISGTGLGGVSSVQMSPNTGITLGSPTPSADGKSVTVPVTVASDAPTTLRKLSAMVGTTPIVPLDPSADRLLITLPQPVVNSIEPLFALPGTPSLTLTVRGKNLQGATAVMATPTGGLIFGTSPIIDASGTLLSVNVDIPPTATIGPRVITVVTPGGNTGALASPANTFTVVNTIQGAITPIESPAVGVVLQSASPPPSIATKLFTSAVGVAVGPVFTGISPTAQSVGRSFTLAIQGFALHGVTSVQLVPSTGITVGAATIGSGGLSLTVPVTLAADAPQTLRKVQLLAGALPILPAPVDGASFQVAALPAQIDSVSPQVLQIGGAPVTLTIRGRNFQTPTFVHMLPQANIAVNLPPTVDASATTLTTTVIVDPLAVPGTRLVTVTTPAGETTAIASPANTILLVANPGTLVTPVIAAPVGVVLTNAAVPMLPIGPVLSPLVGVVLQSTAPPPTTGVGPVTSIPVGVAVGPVALGLTPSSLLLGSTGALTVTGTGLNAVTSTSFLPSSAVSLSGGLTASPDGTQLTIPVIVSASAAPTQVRLNLAATAGPVRFANPASGVFQIAPTTLPSFDSITPILAKQGALLTFTIRGQHLQNVSRVYAEPADGLSFDFNPVVDSTGTMVTVHLQVAIDAPLGARVIRLSTPSGDSSAVAVPANTFTVYPF